MWKNTESREWMGVYLAGRCGWEVTYSIFQNFLGGDGYVILSTTIPVLFWIQLGNIIASNFRLAKFAYSVLNLLIVCQTRPSSSNIIHSGVKKEMYGHIGVRRTRLYPMQSCRSFLIYSLTYVINTNFESKYFWFIRNIYLPAKKTLMPLWNYG